MENDPNDAYLIRRALSKMTNCGESMLCRNPSEAKALLKGAGIYSNREVYPIPDVIITDMRMGHETGMELVDWLREQEPPLRDTPIIIMSGSCSELQFDAASKSSANAVYRKPTRIEELQQLLKAIGDEFCKKSEE